MQKPTDGAQRPTPRMRTDRPRASSASRINGRSIRTARAIRSWFRALPPALDRRFRPAVSGAVRPLLTAERALPIAVAAIVAVASLLALLALVTLVVKNLVEWRAARASLPSASSQLPTPGIPHEH